MTFTAIAIIAGLAAVALGSAKSSSKASSAKPNLDQLPSPTDDFDYMIEDEGDLILDDEEEGEVVFEGSGYGDMPVLQMQSVQHYLALVGFYFGDLNGRYTSDTERAIIDFQVAFGLPATGEPTQDMREVLAVLVTSKPEEELMPVPAPEPEMVAPQPEREYEPGWHPTRDVYLHPGWWPKGRFFVGPDGVVRGEDWFPDNLEAILPQSKVATEYPWDGAALKFGGNLDTQTGRYAVRVHLPVHRCGTRVVNNSDPVYVRYYFHVLTSLKLLAQMYPDVEFLLNFGWGSTTPKLVFYEAMWHPGYIQDAAHCYGCDDGETLPFPELLPTPELVETIVLGIEAMR